LSPSLDKNCTNFLFRTQQRLGIFSEKKPVAQAFFSVARGIAAEPPKGRGAPLVRTPEGDGAHSPTTAEGGRLAQRLFSFQNSRNGFLFFG
jgi:hypothetical protein